MKEEEIIKDINNYINFSNKSENFSDINEYLHCKELARRFQGLLDLYNKEKEKNEELEKYDYRKIKIEENDKISSIHFTKEQLDLMNLGIALYVGIPKILADTQDEETDI